MNRREAIVVLNDYKNRIPNPDFKEACEIVISEMEKQDYIIMGNIELSEMCSKLTNILWENVYNKNTGEM